MPRIPGVRRLFRFPMTTDGIRRDVENEIAFHIESRVRELIESGMAEEAARAAATREFGDVRAARSELEKIGRRRVRHVRRADWWSDFRQDVRYGARSLLHAPLFTLLAITTLALGIGANAAVFTVVKSVLLDALPYRDPSGLVRVYGRMRDGSNERVPLSAGSVDEIGKRQRSFEGLAAYIDQPDDAVYGSDGGAIVTRLGWVGPGFFNVLGVTASQGRTLRDEDGTSGFVPISGGQVGPDTARSVLVTDAAWRRLFGADSAIVGREIRLNGLTRTIVGVLPRGFIGPMGETDFFLAFDLAPVIADPVAVRRSQWLGLIGRLAPAVSLASATTELSAIGAALAREYPQDSGDFGVTARSLRDAMAGDTRRPLVVLLVSAGLVLLIACANLAAALLSRTLTRRKEFAVRAALGAGRGRIVRQLLTESTLIAVAGGAAGLLLANVVLSELQNVALPALPDYARPALDLAAVAVIGLITLATGVGFGLAPALAIANGSAHDALRDESRGSSGGGRSRRLRGVLVACQMALSVSLLAGAGLLARSLWAMTVSPLGFNPDGVLTLSLQLPGRDYPARKDIANFQDRFSDRLRALPGVNAVAHATSVPTAVGSRMGFTIDGVTEADKPQAFVLYAAVSNGYFQTLGIPLREGRTFDARDRAESPPVVVISETMARRYWPGRDALGARIRLGPNPKAPPMEVIGIVGDVRNQLARTDAEPMAYESSTQSPIPFVSFFLRTAADPHGLTQPAAHELAALDRGLAIQRLATLQDRLGDGLAARRLPVLIMMMFSVLALVLASVGIYAMFDSLASARQREFGIRLALGSRPIAIARLLIGNAAQWIAVGLAGGAVGILVVVRLLRDLLYGISAYDPLTIAAAVATLTGCAGIAVVVPLRRATRADPAVTLRAP